MPPLPLLTTPTAFAEDPSTPTTLAEDPSTAANEVYPLPFVCNFLLPLFRLFNFSLILGLDFNLLSAIDVPSMQTSSSRVKQHILRRNGIIFLFVFSFMQKKVGVQQLLDLEAAE